MLTLLNACFALPLEVCHSPAGFYLGTCDPHDDCPLTRDSEYFETHEMATQALALGTWTPRVSH